ncbi:MAG: amino acid adenylation domain-containing protein [Nostoc sp. DedQUE05]|uniref:non-ribosomal peptide synthetase n=1 Tax=Nostoc sp. DedQUE05 TaxID=3075391 RepID=UPI002AD2EB61|nr:non-ribosomal peptide synthetase [Nostoc sp. DedQUE05]MDZ8090962.1 amino acid adenylation domain-containing protein [Nostoc sp. DedQUE05]
MNLLKFLQNLSFQGLELSHDGEKLLIDGSESLLTPDVIAQLQQHKTEILYLLRDRPDILNIYPLSYGQQALWFLWQLAPESSAYNVSFACRICSPVNVRTLQKSFQVIFDRHPQLRSKFFKQGNNVVQQIHQTQFTDFQQINSCDWREQDLEEGVLQEHQQPFNIENDSMMRVRLFTRSQQEHILLMTVHHIAVDAWSILLIIEELITVYLALESGVQPTLIPLDHSYINYVRWQRELLTSVQGEKLWNYWQQKLAGELPVLNLPIDRPRPPIQTYNGASYNFKIPQKLTEELKGLAQTEGISQYIVLLAAFQVLLYRYTGQEDILVGAPTSGRTQPEFMPLVGYFVDPVVIRASLSGNPSFQEFLIQVGRTVSEAIAHQDFPFALLVERLQPQRDLSRSPIFQAVFNFLLQNLRQFEHTQQLWLGGEVDKEVLKLKPFEIAQMDGQFDLNLTLAEGNSSLAGIFKYNTDLFDASTIERMAGHFVTLLEGIVANPQQNISQLPLLTQPEQQQLLAEWNNTQVEYHQNKCIHQLFEEQVARTPDAVAVVFENQQLTYHQLNCRANQLAHYLRSLGVKSDTLVGLCVERTLYTIVGILGILKTGGAYLPLDPEYPTERLSFMLEDAQVKVILTQQQLVDSIPQHQVHLVCLDSDWEKVAQECKSNLDNTATAENLAYIIYTSGSTGKPKGVLVNHSNVVRLFAATDSWYHFSQDDVWTMFHSYAFDFSVWEIWGALLYGGRLVVVPYLVTRSPESFYQLLCTEKVTVLNQTPSAFRQLIQAEQSGITAGELNLRLVIFGGEALEIKSLQPWFDRHGDTLPQLVNMYGITETTVHVTYRPLSKVDLNHSASVIGRPIPDLQVYILDEYFQPVPIGVRGEMYVGGAGVTRGYLNRPELTKQRFISNIFNQSKLYKTGDLARYLPNGDLEYLGRIDNQVKIRGFRIELGEIETLLASHPAIWESAVLVQEDEPGDTCTEHLDFARWSRSRSKRLVAYVVPQVEQSPTVSELRQFLKAKLPEYMVPSAFVLLESLPLTSNGKVDRRALPKPELDSILLEKFVAPRTPMEEMLAQIWAEVLKVEQVGIHDNFFELGGHSLLATQLLSRIRTSFKVELALRELFARATVAELAQSIGQLQQQILRLTSTPLGTSRSVQDLELTSPPILPRTKDAELPLSYAQQRLWFLDQFEPNSPFYNIPIALRLVGNLNRAGLEQSLQEIIHRHEALRTNFITVNEQPTQIIQTETNWKVSVVECQHLSATEQAIATQKLVQQNTIEPFDLSQGALIRATLVVLSETEHILLMCMHHVVSDGWSMSMFVSELAALYNAYAQGRPSPLVPLNGITHITLPPSALAVMPSEELPTLQTIIVAGEACSAELIKQWSVGRNFFNAYGPTEATVCATIGKATPKANAKCTDDDEKISIGKAIANTQIHILDEYLQPVPVGVPGELHIGGVGLARGYLNRPELTQEKFITNPFGTGRLYKTGDLARYLPDGNIEYIGRIDNQVKIRGFRIEIGEIEAALSQHSDVQICCIIAREETPGNTCTERGRSKRLVAYVVPQKDITCTERSRSTLTTSELRQFLSNKLPGYMIPNVFVMLESLPLTPNGKVDRRALPAPDLQQELSDYVMPNTEVESIIAGIWQKALAVEKVGIYNNFFELGGHSLLLVKINHELQEELGLELSIVDMFNYPTIHSLSQYLNTKSYKEESTKQNNYRTQSDNEVKSLRKQQLESRQQYRSQRKR